MASFASQIAMMVVRLMEDLPIHKYQPTAVTSFTSQVRTISFQTIPMVIMMYFCMTEKQGFRKWSQSAMMVSLQMEVLAVHKSQLTESLSPTLARPQI